MYNVINLGNLAVVYPDYECSTDDEVISRHHKEELAEAKAEAFNNARTGEPELDPTELEGYYELQAREDLEQVNLM